MLRHPSCPAVQQVKSAARLKVGQRIRIYINDRSTWGSEYAGLPALHSDECNAVDPLCMHVQRGCGRQQR